MLLKTLSGDPILQYLMFIGCLLLVVSINLMLMEHVW